MNKVTATFIVLLGAASFGVLSTIVKLAYHAGFTTAQVTGSQTLLGCLIMWLICLPTLKQVHRPSWSQITKLLLSGLFNGLTGIFYYLALQSIPASLGVILLFQFTWMGMLADALVQRRMPQLNRWIALAIVLIGTAFAAGLQTLSPYTISVTGIILGLLAAASYTGFIYVSGRVALEVPSTLRGTLIVTGATLLTIIIFPPTYVVDGSLTHGLWIWAALLGLFGIVIPPFLFAKGVPHIGPGVATLLGSIELPVVVVCSALVLKETVSWIQWIGVVFILLGIVLSENRKLLRRHKYVPEPATEESYMQSQSSDLV